MAIPTTRTEFKEFCLRQLGKPVIEINVDDDQVDDAVDHALQYYQDYHYDGAERTYLKHVVTADDISNTYITTSDSIIGVVNVFPIGFNTSTSINNIFNLTYQFALNDLYNLTDFELTPYYMNRMNLSLIEEMLIGKQPFRYNRHINRIYLDMDWERVKAGDYIIFEVYAAIDPDTYPDIWKDWWLQEYTTQLVKRQWGANMKKFEGMQLPGGTTFNGQQTYDEADTKIKEMEENMITGFALPVGDMIG